MSDGQTKKRKEKRKKKDDLQDDVGDLNDSVDEVIHVQKESGIGGNVFTKLIFFVILAALGLVLGLSFLKYNDPSEGNAETVIPSPLAVSLEELLFQIPFVEDVLTGEIFKSGETEESLPKDNDDDGSESGKEVSGQEDESSFLSWVTFGLLDSSPSGDDSKADHEKGHDDEELDEHADDDEEEGHEDDEVDEEHEEEEEESEDDHDETGESEEGENEEDEEPASPEVLDDGERSNEEEEEEEGELEASREEDVEERGSAEQEEEEEEEGEDEGEADEGDQGEEEEQESLDEEEEEDQRIESGEEDNEDNREDEGSVEQMDEEKSIKGDNNQSEENKNNELDDIDEEELFPEAAEALRLEREALEQSKVKSKPAPVEEPDEKSSSVFDEWFEEEPEETKTDGIALKFGVGVCLVVVAHIVLVKKWNSWVAHTQPKAEKAEIGEPEVVPVTPAPAPQPSSPSPEPEQSKSQYISPSTVQDIIDRYGGEDEYSEGDDEEEDEDHLIEEPISNARYQNLMADFYKGGDRGSDIESDPELPEKEYTGRKDDESENEVETGSEVEPSEGEEEEEEEEEEDEEPVAVQRTLWASSVKKEDPVTESEDEEEEEEEESDDEPPPPPVKPKPTGGARSAPEEHYPHSEITNEEDWYIREQLDRAEEEFQFRSLDRALSLFESLMSHHPNSSRARYGRAKVLDKMAEEKRSNAVLDAAIEAYLHTLKAPNVPEPLLVLVAERAIDRMRFKGLHLKAAPVHELLINKFSSIPKYHVNYAVTYLMINRLKNAEAVLKKALSLFPEDPPILAYYGLVLKLSGQTSECIEPLGKGLASDHPETRDSRLYFHLGDALSRVGRNNMAMEVYEKAVKLGLIRSKYQRSLYNVDHLKAQPWWTSEQTTYGEYFKKLEDNWMKIRDEGMAALKIRGTYLDETESLRDVGDWKQFEIFARGVKNKNNCNKVPFTCGLISDFVAAKTCKRGQVKFSIMEPGTHVWPHCGPTNCRLRAHLGLVVPSGPYIRVAETTRMWAEGKVIIFDDSFEHEVWHNGTSFRLVLIVDVWHPGLSEQERKTLSAI